MKYNTGRGLTVLDMWRPSNTATAWEWKPTNVRLPSTCNWTQLLDDEPADVVGADMVHCTHTRMYPLPQVPAACKTWSGGPKTLAGAGRRRTMEVALEQATEVAELKSQVKNMEARFEALEAK